LPSLALVWWDEWSHVWIFVKFSAFLVAVE
jgi:hypothetical protein